MPTDPPPDDTATPLPNLTRKEQARQQRRTASLKGKGQRAKDPRLIAITAAMKVRERAAQQLVKERRKAAVAAQDQKQREQQVKARDARDAATTAVVTSRTKPQ
jgi:hypothetical protein